MKTVVVGGTGTLGNAVVAQLYNVNPYSQITVFSRDELKQSEMAKIFPEASFVLGSVDSRQALERVFDGAQLVIHCAALKQVDRLEDNPEECFRTNVQGTLNVAHAAEGAGVPRVLFSSTDKAVDPVNVYGYSKALAEKILFAENRRQSKTRFQVFRWGNVLGSRGSMLPLIVKHLKNDTAIPLTDPEMTRFWIKIQEAAAFMIESLNGVETLCIPPMRAASVRRLIQATAAVLNSEKPLFTKNIGIRPGEKIHESLRSLHDVNHVNSRTCAHFTLEELTEYIRPVVERLIA